MASLCIAVLWVELVWNAYANPLLTAAIILAVSAGSFIFSLFFKRTGLVQVYLSIGCNQCHIFHAVCTGNTGQ